MSGKRIAESDVENARRLLRQVRARLDQGTADRADHRRALEAMLLLPELEACCWFQEFQQRFGALYLDNEPARGVRSSQPAMALARTNGDGGPVLP